MKIQPQQLENLGYKFLGKVPYNRIPQFAIRTFTGSKWPRIVYYTLLSACSVFALYRTVFLSTDEIDSLHSVNLLFIGLIGSTFLVPLHEYTHLAAFKLMGAKHAKFVCDIRNLNFLAAAPNFVCNKTEFSFAAFAPLVLISALLMPFCISGGQITGMFACGMLLGHTVSCIGDFGMVAVWGHDREIITYDDHANRETVFYTKTIADENIYNTDVNKAIERAVRCWGIHSMPEKAIQEMQNGDSQKPRK